ncbi:MAG: VCBS repeat-containing protein, partial [Vicinamibacterales bacterium]
MVKTFRFGFITVVALVLALPTVGKAQDINLATGGADPIWKGTQPNAGAGTWLDQGAVGAGDSRRDLIVGAPGGAGVAGVVYVLFGGPERTGEVSLSEAQTIITSAEAGNRFGASTAAGNILNTEGTIARNLVVGAPGASGGRGAVYLFAGGFAHGAALTQADAALTILGRTGDALGTAVATGDLDGDGHREIILGAPGNNRVYVIKGGPSLSGTIDLTVTAPARTYSAPGLGSVLTAGDVTGDNIYDVVAGAPSINFTFVFAGAKGTIPAAATTSFSGIDTGDEAGSAVRIMDIDGDGQRDLVISAPGGDGPNNDRANAGEAFVYLGPIGPGATNLGTANIAFFGSAAGVRLGEHLTAGDINRDLPNDLVLLASGGTSGAGTLEIYYGRARTSIG